MGKITVVNANGIRLDVSDTIPESMLSEMGFAILKTEAIPDNIKNVEYEEEKEVLTVNNENVVKKAKSNKKNK